MNNKTQRRFDQSTKDAAKASRRTRENDRAVRARWEREGAQTMRIATAPACEDLDAFIAELVERDGQNGRD